jgi:3-deoxy-7-phosphoheptulonate synthase
MDMWKSSGAFAPFRIADRQTKPEGSIVRAGGVEIGGPEVVVIAGPCAVESRDQLFNTAKAVKAGGARMLRGGAFKPRTSPYSFRGLKEEGLELLAAARDETGLPVVTEVMDTRQVEQVCKHADVLQVGSRSMQNFPLLDEVGQSKMPVLLKRGMAATIEEFLLAAEYILAQGNEDVMLCERGIRTFENSMRNTLDLNAVPMLKRMTHLPVAIDPSHGTGHAWMVPDLCLGAVAVGASDGAQSLHPDRFHAMMVDLRKVAAAVGRTVADGDRLA